MSRDLARVLEEIERAIRTVAYGSVEVIIQNSRVVQIERKEKFRFSGS
ncbi:MAG: YezD family protein [Candidatus Binataceae bacterium]